MRKSLFFPILGEMGSWWPKNPAFCIFFFFFFLQKFVMIFSWICSKIKTHVLHLKHLILQIVHVKGQELQESFKCNISRKEWAIKLVFCMWIKVFIKLFQKFILSFLTAVAKHAQIAQNNKFATSFWHHGINRLWETVARRCSEKFRKIYRKTHVPESLVK